MKLINNAGFATLRGDASKSMKQLSLNISLYLMLYTGAILTFDFSSALFIAFAIALGVILIRIFIIQHDCAHYSYFKEVSKNKKLGFLLSALTHVPHYYWGRQHAYHHAHTGNLEGRDVGDIWLLTTAEFEASPLWYRLLYRLYRNPFVMIVLGGFFQFFIMMKLPITALKANKLSLASILKTNLFLALRITALCYFFGWEIIIAIEVLAVWVAAMLGIVLFYVQHNYKEAYWTYKNEWNYQKASLKGSSFLNFGHIGHWLTGNIGYHHIHHLDSKIPNYYLAKAHQQLGSHPDLTSLSLLDIPMTFSLKLWDENKAQLVKFGV